MAQRHGYAILQRMHAFPQRVVHCALLVQRRKRHLPNTSNTANGAGASRAPTNPAHCKKHLLPTSPIQGSRSLKNCVSLPHKNSPLTRAPVPQVLIIIQRPSCHILVSLRRLPLPQRHPSSRTMRKRYPENACRTRRAKTAKPTQEPTLLQHYLPFLVHAKPSTPTNIG